MPVVTAGVQLTVVLTDVLLVLAVLVTLVVFVVLVVLVVFVVVESLVPPLVPAVAQIDECAVAISVCKVAEVASAPE